MLTTDSDLTWIDDLTDDQCIEIFWLYVDPPEPFLESHSAPLLGAAMRHALRIVAGDTQSGVRRPASAEGHLERSDPVRKSDQPPKSE